MAGADRGRGRRGKGRGEPVLALWYGNKHFAGKGGKEGLRARRVWRSGVGEKIGKKKKKRKNESKTKEKKIVIFCKKQRAEHTRLSAEQEAALLPSLRAESWRVPQGCGHLAAPPSPRAAVGLSCSCSCHRSEEAAVCQQLSSSHPSLPLQSCSLCHHKAPRSFPAMQNGGAQRLGSLLLCSMAALELCLNPVIKDGPQKQENKMSQLP